MIKLYLWQTITVILIFIRRVIAGAASRVTHFIENLYLDDKLKIKNSFGLFMRTFRMVFLCVHSE